MLSLFINRMYISLNAYRLPKGDVPIDCRDFLSYKNLGQQKIYKSSMQHFKIRNLGDNFREDIYLNFSINSSNA